MTKEINGILKVLNGEKPDKAPVWFMRQAGRYLPEYRALRSTATNFMQTVLTPELATEITMQPMRRYPLLDAAILFADILVIPYALGQKVDIIKGEGVKLGPMPHLEYKPEKLRPILETVSRVRQKLPEHKTLIGFAGAPWTVACYMISGSSENDFMEAKQMAFKEPERLDDILTIVTDATIDYLMDQIVHGAQVIQIFESWAELLTGHTDEFYRFIIEPTQRIVSAIRDKYPEMPIIGFPRACGQFLPAYAKETRITAIGLDWGVDIEWVNSVLPKNMPVQGNLDPVLLLTGGQAMIDKARYILDVFSDRPLIFNLGHGVIRFTPPEHLEELLKEIKS